MEIQSISLDLIDADEEFNCRGPILPMDVAPLAKDIEQHGLIQPISVCPASNGRYKLLAGFRRVMAFRVLKWTEIPAVIRAGMSEVDARLFNLAENLQRKELNPLQEAQAVSRLAELGMIEEDIATKLNRSRGWVQIRMMILKLPQLVREYIAAGYLNQTQIRDAYSHYINDGEEACYNVIKAFKNDALAGKKGTRKPAKKKNKTGCVKKRWEIFAVQDHIRKFLGNSIITRTLAWCSGEISDEEYCDDLIEHAGDKIFPRFDENKQYLEDQEE